MGFAKYPLRCLCLAAALAVWPFVAQAQQPGTRCLPLGDPLSPDVQISECTAAIESGSWSGRMLALAFVRRGSAHVSKRDYDRALADFNDAVRIFPSYWGTYVWRGNTYTAKRDYDRAIEDYDTAIRLFPESPVAFVNRGNVHGIKGDTDRAIADFSEAIRLAPMNAVAHRKRGFGYFLKGENDRAISDLSEAIRLKPDDSRAHFDRGIAYFYDDSIAKAVADLDRASELDPKHAHSALWQDIAARRNAVPSRLSEAVLHIDMDNWPAPVIRLFLDQTTPAAVIAAADDPDPATKQDRLCEAQFYSGLLALRHDAKEEAVRLLRLAEHDCPKKFIERRTARMELKRLGAAP